MTTSGMLLLWSRSVAASQPGGAARSSGSVSLRRLTGRNVAVLGSYADVQDAIQVRFMPNGTKVPSECGISMKFGVQLLEEGAQCVEGEVFDEDRAGHCCPVQHWKQPCDPPCDTAPREVGAIAQAWEEEWLVNEDSRGCCECSGSFSLRGQPAIAHSGAGWADDEKRGGCCARSRGPQLQVRAAEVPQPRRDDAPQKRQGAGRRRDCDLRRWAELGAGACGGIVARSGGGAVLAVRPAHAATAGIAGCQSGGG